MRKYSDQQFIQAVMDSRSIREVLGKLGLKEAGGNYKIARKRIEELNLDTSHFGGQGWAKGLKFDGRHITPLSDALVENSTYQTYKLKLRLIKGGFFQQRCSNCGLVEWLGQPIPLELDHINGNDRDHRLENLRLLCSNCHALTANFRGKNKKRC